MKLSSFSVTNYRSITKAHKINIKNYTVLVGQNNQGKSNLLKALNTALEILRNRRNLDSYYYREIYNWNKDFPLQFQSRSKGLETIFRLDFELDEYDTEKIYKNIGSKLKERISFEIKIGKDNIPQINVIKLGKNTEKLSKKILYLSEYLKNNISLTYIPAVRRDEDAIDQINEMISEELKKIEEVQEYSLALETINKIQQERLNIISKQVLEEVQMFLPSIKNVKIEIEENRRRKFLRTNISIKVDDGVCTDIKYKGDGIKSILTLAMLEQQSDDYGIIAIEEPEAHLHPFAIHQLNEQIKKINNKQVIISTHNPIFVNTMSIEDNILVHEGKVKIAKKIDEIREILGVETTDNLINYNFVLFVEGKTDKMFLEKIFSLMSTKITNAIKNRKLYIQECESASKMIPFIVTAKSILVKPFVLVDNDNEGKQICEKIINKGLLSINEIKLVSCQGMKTSEIEDSIKPSLFEEMLKSDYGIEIKKSKNKCVKFSERLSEAATILGVCYTEKTEYEVKNKIMDLVAKSKSIDEILIEQKSQWLYSLIELIEKIL